MSRLMAKRFDCASAVAKLSGVANSFGSFVFEWLCIATVILYFSTNGTRRGTVFRFDDAVISFTPSAWACSKPFSISRSVKLSLKLTL